VVSSLESLYHLRVWGRLMLLETDGSIISKAAQLENRIDDTYLFRLFLAISFFRAAPSNGCKEYKSQPKAMRAIKLDPPSRVQRSTKGLPIPTSRQRNSVHEGSIRLVLDLGTKGLRLTSNSCPNGIRYKTISMCAVNYKLVYSEKLTPQ
jgi:hypothetical protein